MKVVLVLNGLNSNKVIYREIIRKAKEINDPSERATFLLVEAGVAVTSIDKYVQSVLGRDYSLITILSFARLLFGEDIDKSHIAMISVKNSQIGKYYSVVFDDGNNDNETYFIGEDDIATELGKIHLELYNNNEYRDKMEKKIVIVYLDLPQNSKNNKIPKVDIWDIVVVSEI